ncbi:Multidrug resistance protein MdtN [Pseudovibrio axinellae]|uniref:Multidrug resistance protein MdtN n=1 Tax=Pseudovibrio axinellae TaxID=989403 RepID=A0A166AMF4_9HYPH|nr:HlyD family secretion protein [Pseudovibrio axinellae]KZL21310.1 Multidrug resistance protein MdtN [Pseudovibrio axinellae]SEQ95663.1 membrane fusion protein, multidrug efflux system/membrane fusion protein, multidrug efflux system [Pseudovibrio axinellae]
MPGGISQISGPVKVILGACALIGAYVVIDYFFTYTADAYVSADVILVSPEISGFVTEIPVDRNQMVGAGELLMQIDPEPFALAVQQARATEAKALANLRRSEAEVQVSEASVTAAVAKVANLSAQQQRFEELTDNGFVTQQRLDDITLSLEEANAETDSARDSLRAAAHQVEVMRSTYLAKQAATALAQYNLRKSSLLSPVEGVVSEYSVNPGNFVLQGVPQLALITNGNWRIIANLIERHAARLSLGQTVWFQVSSDPYRIHRGTVKSIGRGVSRIDENSRVLPYIPLTTDWIRLSQRFPVEIDMGELLEHHKPMYGGDARIFLVH